MGETSLDIVAGKAAQASTGASLWDVVAGRVLACIIVVLAAYLLYRLIMFPVRKFLVNNEHSRRGGTIFKNIVRAGVSIWAGACVLDIAFDIDMAGILGALGIVGVAVSLGAQQTIANLIDRKSVV